MEVGLWLGLGFRFRVSLVSSIFVPVEVEICGREIDLRRIQEFQEFKMSRIQEFKSGRDLSLAEPRFNRAPNQ